MFHMIRPDRFKHRLLSLEFLQSESMIEAVSTIQKALKLWQDKKIHDWEWVSLYVFILSAFRRPSDFWGGPHNEVFAQNVAGHLSMSDVRGLFSNPGRTLLKIPSGENFFALFCQRSLRSIPLSVQKSLALWSQKDVLRLCEYIPSPEEVMRLQSLGLRCVSVLTDPLQMKTFVEEGRDVLGFVVHDLIHADHFFADPQQAKAQIKFSNYLEKLHGLPQIQERLRADIEFMGEWHYLISDMNSVPLHLFKTLKAILLAAHKRKWNIDFKASLSNHSEISFRTEIGTLGTYFNFSEAQHQAWQRLNSPEFNFPDDAYVLVQALE